MATSKKKSTSQSAAKSSSGTSAAGSSKSSASKSGSRMPKGKILAAGAGVAAAAVAAGVAYMRGRGDDRSVYHVLPASEGWQVKGDGAERAVSNHPTKKEALTAARELAHNKVPSQLVVHKADGSVQESWSYDAE